jgi:hypothetical protein
MVGVREIRGDREPVRDGVSEPLVLVEELGERDTETDPVTLTVALKTVAVDDWVTTRELLLVSVNASVVAMAEVVIEFVPTTLGDEDRQRVGELELQTEVDDDGVTV